MTFGLAIPAFGNASQRLYYRGSSSRRAFLQMRASFIRLCGTMGISRATI